MPEELDRELIEVQTQLREREKAQHDLAAVQRSLQWQRARQAELARTLAREGADVERLEGLSLPSLFYTVLGSKDDQLEKERQEYLAAKLKYDECSDAVAALEREQAELQARLAQLDGLEARYQALRARRETALRQGGGEAAARLEDLLRDLAGAAAAAKELREAISAGNAALAGLEEVIHALNSASNWGTWDVLGGGTLATLAKHSRLDDARTSAHRVQQLLRRFQRELADVAALHDDLTIEVGSFATFADFFFDGLIADWVVQSRIERSRESVARVQAQVRQAVRRLGEQLDETRRREAELEAERQRLIAGTP